MADTKLKARPTPARRPPAVRRASPTVNRTLVNLIRNGPLPSVQTKLKIGAANDPAEKEADMVADRVLSGPPVQTMVRVNEVPPTAPPRRSGPMDQPSTDTLQDQPPVPANQQDIELPKDEDVETDALDPATLSEVESGEPVSEEPDPAAQPRRRPAPMVGPEGGDAPASVSRAIEHPGPGRPLPKAVRADLEPRFGADFSDVHLHDRPADREATEAIGARAFAYKSGIWLGDGERAEDRRLMAHELTHVLQQTGRDRTPLLAGKSAGAVEPKRTVNRFLGDAILEKIESYARHIPGYTLISYVLGKTPIARKPVHRTAENLIYAVLGLHPLGTMLADKLKETRALQSAYEWVTGQLSRLNLNWTRIEGVIAKAKDLFSVLSPLQSIKPAFKPLLRDIMIFVGAVKDKVLEFILKGALKLAGPMAEKVWGVIQMAGNTIKLILADPLKFVANLFKSVVKGFGLFFSNILTHLKKGLLGFIFGALNGIDIQLPDKLNLQGIVSIIFQVLRLTWVHIRKQLVKRLGPNGERKVAILEKTVDIIKLLITEGVMGIWKKMLAMIDNLTSTVMSGIISFITTTLVKGALGWLAGLSNPVGAVIKVALMIYDFIVMLLERMQQIMDFVKSIFGSIAAIAKGNIDNAAKAVEDAIGRTVPLILAFLAALIPITGIASKIQSIMRKLRKPVDKAIGKLISFLIKKGKKILAKIIGKVNAKRKLPAATFNVGKKTHKLYAKKKGKGVGIFVQTTETGTDDMSRKLETQYKAFEKDEEVSDEEKAAVRAFIVKFEEETNAVEKEGKDVKPGNQTKGNAKENDELQGAATAAGSALSQPGEGLTGRPHVDTSAPVDILRYKTALSEFEGMADSYGKLATEKKKKKHNKDDTRVLELDHNPNLASLHKIRTWLRDQGESKNKKGVIYFKETKKGGASDAEAAKAKFGRLSVSSTKRPGTTFPAMAIYGPYNSQMSVKDAERAAQMGSFLEGKTVSDLSAVKTELQEQRDKKLDEINELYAGEPDPLKNNIRRGSIKLKKLGKSLLKLEGTTERTPAQQKVLGDRSVRIAHTKVVAGVEKKFDFEENEGLAGRYGSLSGKNTLKGYLEADHMPMKAEMNQTKEWTIGTFLRDDEVERIQDHPVFKTQKDEEKRKAGKALAGDIPTGLLQKEDTQYKENAAGAVVVAYGINQHSTMTKGDKDLAKKIHSSVAANYTPATRLAIALKLATGKSAEEAAVPARRTLNNAIRWAIRARIVERQQRAFNLYATDEAPMIKKANEATGTGNEAVGKLSRIAARVKSSQTTSKIMEHTEKFFPV